GGELVSRRAPLQQAPAERALKLTHPHADGRLRHLAAAGRLALAAELRDRTQCQRDQAGRRRPQHYPRVTQAALMTSLPKAAGAGMRRTVHGRLASPVGPGTGRITAHETTAGECSG